MPEEVQGLFGGNILSGTAFIGWNLPWKPILVIRRIDASGDTNLLQVVYTGDTLCLGLCLCQCRQEHAGQNGNDCYNDQQLDEREGPDFVFLKMLHDCNSRFIC